MRKLFKILIFTIPIIIIAVFVFFSLFINTAVKKSVETFGPRFTETPVNLEGVKLSLFSGRGEIKELVVGNPEGFHTDSAFELGKIIIDLQPMSIFSDHVIIREILIEGPIITYETSLSGSNIAQIKKNIEKYSSRAEEDEPETVPTEQEEPTKVQIDQFLFQDGKVRLSAKLLKGKTLDIPLVKIQINDIGKDTNGATFPEVIEKIVTAVVKAVVDAVSQAGGGLEEKVKTLEESGKKIEEKAKEGMTDVVDKMKKLFDK